MTDPFVPRAGAVLSADIAVPEHARVVEFYTAVLRTGTRPLWGDDLMNDLGMPIIGIGERVEAYAELPLQWMPHIQVEDVGASVEEATRRGGRALMHAKDDQGGSQWAVLSDPDGAAFGLIPVSPPPPEPAEADAATRAKAGRIAWLDLTVHDADAARDFYAAVIGWTPDPASMKDDAGAYSDYCMLAGGQAVAGVCHARGPNLGLPPVWMLYVPVGDLNASIAAIEPSGGSVLEVMRGKGDAPTGVILRDPIGAHMALVAG